MALVAVEAGCVHSTRGAVRTSMDEFAKRDNWHKLEQPARELSQAITGGVLDELGANERRAVVDQMLEEYVSDFMRALALGIDQDLGPALERQVEASVASVLDAALAEPVKVSSSDLVDRLMRSAIGALGPTLAAELRFEIGPALAGMLEQDLGPAIGQATQRALERKLGPAMDKLLREHIGPAIQEMLERNLGPGMDNMLREHIGPALAHVLEHDVGAGLERAIARQPSAQTLLTIERMSEAASRGAARGAYRELQPLWSEQARHATGVAHGVVALVAALAAALVGGLALWAYLRLRRRQRAALYLLVSEIRGMADVPDIHELTRRIKRAGMRGEGGATLDDFLRRHPELRVSASHDFGPRAAVNRRLPEADTTWLSRSA